MSSPWKRVDLFRLSSVTGAAAAAVARRRTAAARAAVAPTQTPQDVLSTSAQDDNKRDLGKIADMRDVTRQREYHDAQQPRLQRLSGVAQPTVRPAAAATRVSISRLLNGPSLTWRESLACFVSLVERYKIHPQHRKTSSIVQDENIVPLEAILSLYAVLRRNTLHQEQAVTGRGDELRPTSSNADETEHDLIAEVAFTPEAAQVLVPNRHRTCPKSLSNLPSSADLLPLRFLAYAAQHHTALKPVHAVLATAFHQAGENSSLSPSLAMQFGYPQEDSSVRCGFLPLEVAEELMQFLSVSTLLHVGLGGLLQGGSPTTSGLSSFPLHQRWAALRTIHHLEHYGGARDYLDALSRNVQDNVQVSRGSGANVCRPSLHNQNGKSKAVSAKELSHVTLDQKMLSIATPSLPRVLSVVDSTTETYGFDLVSAKAVLAAAARRTPNFTLMFLTLQEAWEAHNARQLATTTPTQWTIDVGDTGADGDVVVQSNNEAGKTISVNADHTVEDAVSASDAAADVALAMARSLAETNSSASQVALNGEQNNEDMSCGIAMSTAELTGLTLDVVHFAWKAMNVRHASQPLAKGEQTEGQNNDIMRDAEGESLLQLVRAATRFVSYTDLYTWLDRLLPLNTTRTTTALHVSNRTTTLPDTMTMPQQRESLLCLLTRAVQRAPSWSAACIVLREIWPRIPKAVAKSTAFFHLSQTMVLQNVDVVGGACESGFASCPALLNAFFDSPYTPTRRPHTRDELALWCKAICTPRGFSRRDKRANSELRNMPFSVERTGETGPGKDEDQLYPEMWSQLLYGVAPHNSAVTLRHLKQWHSSVTSASIAFVRRWLLPAAAHDTALDCLAACHAQCAASWAAALPPPRSSTCTPDSDMKNDDLPEDDAMALKAEAVMELAHQHRLFSSVFLTQEEAFDWFNWVLCRTERGAARQLVLTAAMKARWGSRNASTPTLSMNTASTAVKDLEDTRVASSSLSSSPSSSTMTATTTAVAVSVIVADLTRIFHRWIESHETATTTTVIAKNDSAALSLLSDTPFHREGVSHLGEVGALFDDVATVLHSAAAPPFEFYSCTSSSPSWSSKTVVALLAVVRRAVTKVGLRWERQMCRSSVHDNDINTVVKLPLLFHKAAIGMAVQRHLSFNGKDGFVEELPLQGQRTRLARLRDWLKFLCTCPPLLLKEEESVVVWLYILMRQVEEMHGTLTIESGSATGREQLQLGFKTQLELGENTPLHTRDVHLKINTVDTCDKPFVNGGELAWSRQEEEAAVRLVATSLSQQLWSSLPSSSLLPPMLLNWLLTRGGLHDWGDAVRFLRAAAASRTKTRAQSQPKDALTGGREKCEGHDEVDSEDQRRYLFLVLPLDRVVSMPHAMRVLRTLQAVEKRCKESAQRFMQEETQLPEHERAQRSPCSSSDDRVSKIEDESKGAAPPRRLRDRHATPSATTVSLKHLRECTIEPSSSAQDDAVARLVRYYYREIERVLLREWYGRALAAVLRFLAQRPEHTFITSVVDAPDHVAQTWRARLSDGQAHNMQGNTTYQETQATLFDPLHASDFRYDDGCGDVRVASLRGWQQRPHFSDQLVNAEEIAKTEPVEMKTTSLPATVQTVTAKEKKVASADGNALESYTTTTTMMGKQDVNAEKGHQHNSTFSATASLDASATTATYAVVAPLQFLGAFIMQECRIGAPVSNPFVEEIARLAAIKALSKLSSSTSDSNLMSMSLPTNHEESKGRANASVPSKKRGRMLSPFFVDKLLKDTTRFLATDNDRLDSPQSTEADGKHLPDTRRARPVDPELLELFKQVLEIKKAERTRVNSVSTAQEETVEDVVCEVLASHATAF